MKSTEGIYRWEYIPLNFCFYCLTAKIDLLIALEATGLTVLFAKV